MSQARQRILDKLRTAVAQAETVELPAEQPFDYPLLTREQQLAQFTTLLENNHAEVQRLRREAIAPAIADALARRGITQLLHGAQSRYAAELAALSTDITLRPFDFALADHKQTLFDEVPAALTNSHAAIAATGSIVLWPDADEPRSMSLIPPLHIVIVDSEQLYPDFASLIRQQQWQRGLPTNVVLVSGPSKTADIQQTLAYGAHGPRELLVLLIEH